MIKLFIVLFVFINKLWVSFKALRDFLKKLENSKIFS